MEGNAELEHENERMGGVPTTVEPRQIVNESAVQGEVGTSEERAVVNMVRYR